jgi:hypothetical protein
MYLSVLVLALFIVGTSPAGEKKQIKADNLNIEQEAG